MKDFLRTVWRWVRWPILVLVFLYAVLVGFRTFVLFDEDKTAEAVAQIHAQKITLADVMGDTMIKTDVDRATYDATVAGIDSNSNGIRDDVEMAIWKKYPNSAKIRAAELQYAMAEQMYLARVFNTATWKAVAEEVGRAQLCVIDMSANRKEIESWIFNTQMRNDAREKAYAFITSYGPASGAPCDVLPK